MGLEITLVGNMITLDNILIQHHEAQPTVSVEGMGIVEADNLFLLPILEPEVTWDPAVVLVDLAVTTFPVVELAEGDS